MVVHANEDRRKPIDIHRCGYCRIKTQEVQDLDHQHAQTLLRLKWMHLAPQFDTVMCNPVQAEVNWMCPAEYSGSLTAKDEGGTIQ